MTQQQQANGQQQQPPQSIVKTERDQYQAIVQVLDKRRSEIQKALPQFLRNKQDTFLRTLLTTVQNGGLLLKCDPISLYTSALFAAQQGLMLDPFLGHGYLVPFWNSHLYGKGKGGYEAKFMPGYRGYIELSMRTGKVSSVAASVVFEGDIFDLELGLMASLRHKPTMDPKKRGEALAAYDVFHLKNVPREEHPFHVMLADEVLAIRERSKGAFDKEGNLQGPWKTDWKEMWKKTPIRQHAKLMQLSPELTQLAVYDEYADRGLASITEAGEVVIDHSQDEHAENGSGIKQPQRTQPQTIDARESKQEPPIEVKTQTPEAQQEEQSPQVDNRVELCGAKLPHCEGANAIDDSQDWPHSCKFKKGEAHDRHQCGTCGREWDEFDEKKEATQPRSSEAAKPAEAEKKAEQPAAPRAANPSAVSKAKLTRLFAILNSAKSHTEEELRAFCKQQFGIDSMTDLPVSGYEAACKFAGGDKLKV